MDNELRQMISRGVIALSVCMGGYMLLVSPAKEELLEARGRGRELALKVQDAESVRDQVPQLTEAMERLKAEAGELSELGELARNERRLYAQVIATAERHAVRIDQLAPSSSRASAKTQPAVDAEVGYQLTATGSYASIAELVRSLQSELGFAVVRSVRLYPRNDQSDADEVRAVIETVHFSFDVHRTPRADQMASAEGGL